MIIALSFRRRRNYTRYFLYVISPHGRNDKKLLNVIISGGPLVGFPIVMGTECKSTLTVVVSLRDREFSFNNNVSHERICA
jgi:hypothetical protein